MLKKILFSLFTAGLFFFLVMPTIIPGHAAGLGDTANDLSIIYCDKRKGNQMNLETWYGGKCDTDNLEESIGFGDIILLDLLEKTAGNKSDDTNKINQLLQNLLNSNQPLPTISFSPSDSALMGSAKAISFLLQQRPASSLDYLAYVNQNLSNKRVVKPAYAQEGYGFQVLQPILPIWKTLRDIAYFIFVIGFVVYGFMIMFRIKVNPQTVISIQLALPKLIATLLLITFSYAIAGLLIDLFYIITGLTFNLFLGGIMSDNMYSYIASGFGLGVGGPLMLGYLHLIFGGLTVKLLSAILVFPPWAVAILSKTLFGPLSVVLALVLAIALLFTFLKVIWMLLKSYIIMLLNIIFAPIILLGNILPGSKSFGNWLKNILAELSVFISTMVMFILAFYFIGPIKGFGLLPIVGMGDPLSNGPAWLPPPLVGQTLQNWGITYNSEGWMAVIGVGMLLMTPKIAEMIKNALQIKDYGYGSAIGEALMWGPKPLVNTIGGAMQKKGQENVLRGYDAVRGKSDMAIQRSIRRRQVESHLSMLSGESIPDKNKSKRTK